MTTLPNNPDNPEPPGPPGMPPKLIVFARYPEPGKAKTRLIPALGPEGAARLQEEMTRFTLARFAPLSRGGVSIEIRYAGGDERAMRALYGPGWEYRPQVGGDLGARLSAAAEAALDEGHPAVALIGTDCPDVGPEAVEEAFSALATKDLVLGPAADGGYYLIALRRAAPEVFESIPWGTGAVLAATRAAAEAMGLRVALLSELRDVDLPEDLPVWENASGRRCEE